jgi:Xaa-Pro aminopeptidase/thioredoxin reductase
VSCDVAVVGAGAAGLRAATAAAGAGAATVLLDSYLRAGGQYYRQPAPGHHPSRTQAAGYRLIDQARAAGVEIRTGVSVWDAEPGCLHLVAGGRSEQLDCRALVVATGAYERVAAFPGWTLPGVYTAGAVQSLLKEHGVLAGRRVLLAGSGPLLLVVAAELARRGVAIAGVLEATRLPREGAAHPWTAAAGLWRQGARVREGVAAATRLARARVRVRTGWGVVRALGEREVEAAVIARLDRRWRPVPGTERTIACDTVATHYSLEPAVDLLRLLGARLDHRPELGGWVPVCSVTATSVPGVFAAGDCTGIGGVGMSLVEGALAGAAAAAYALRREPHPDPGLLGARGRERRFQRLYGSLFAARAGRRVAATQRAIRERGIDVLLVHAPENICYLTGYETSGYFEYQTLAVPAEGTPALLIRNVERLNVDEYSWLDRAHVWRDGDDFIAATAAIVRRLSPGGRVALERHSWFVPADTAARLGEQLTGYELVGSERLVERIRLVKSEPEIDYIRQAARLADLAMAAAVAAARPGASENLVAAAAHAAQISAGGEYPALPHYISSGDRLELGHAHWTDAVLRAGDLVKMEYLGVRRRYHAGLTRPVSIGTPRDAGLVADVDLCVRLQDETFADLRPGVLACDVTRAAQRRLADAGRAAFKIRLGYSVGIGFPPIAGEGQTADFRESADWPLAAGMVFHMLSVLRVGLVVSDTVLITATGCERLTSTPRELLVAP